MRKYIKKWFVKQWLVLGILTLITSPLSSMEEPMKEVIDLEFSDGNKAVYSSGGLSFKGPVSIACNFCAGQTEIQYGSVRIDRTRKFAEVVKDLQSTSGIKSATLRFVSLSPDEKYAKELAIFAKARAVELLPQQEVLLIRTFYDLTRRFSQEGSQAASGDIPLLQSSLGIAIANEAQSEENLRRVTLLREAVNLLEVSAGAGIRGAIVNAPVANYMLGVSLINSINEEVVLEKSIPVLREGIQFICKGKNRGDEKQLAVAQYLLAHNLYLTVFPNQSVDRLINDAELGPLKEAHELLASAKMHCPAAVGLFGHVRSILVALNPSMSSELDKMEDASIIKPVAIPPKLEQAIREAKAGTAAFWELGRLVEGKETYRREDYLPLYLQLLEDPDLDELVKSHLVKGYPHPELICFFLSGTSSSVDSGLVKLLCGNKGFMKEKGILFFSKLISRKEARFFGREIFNTILEVKCYTLGEIVDLVCEAVKGANFRWGAQSEVLALLVKIPGYNPKVHGMMIAKSSRPDLDPYKISNNWLYDELLEQLEIKQEASDTSVSLVEEKQPDANSPSVTKEELPQNLEAPPAPQVLSTKEKLKALQEKLAQKRAAAKLEEK
jgi:hypothetical protein